MHFKPIVAFLVGALAMQPLTAAAAEVMLLETFKDWSAFKHESDAETVCFATTRPKDVAPKVEGATEAYLYLSYYPKEGIRSEVSLKLSYPAKKGSSISVSIGSDVFRFNPKKDRAFLDNLDAEKKFLDALRKGEKLVVKGTPAKGDETIEVYSLIGVSDAMKKAEAACL